MKPLRIALAVAALAALSGCMKPQSAYTVAPLHFETVKGHVDGQWFERNIYGKEGIETVELVYCPVMPKQATVCRVAVVWRYGHTDLIPQ